jgi:hypothetical protein
MATLFDLMKDPQTSPNTIGILAPSLERPAISPCASQQLPRSTM